MNKYTRLFSIAAALTFSASCAAEYTVPGYTMSVCAFDGKYDFEYDNVFYRYTGDDHTEAVVCGFANGIEYAYIPEYVNGAEVTDFPREVFDTIEEYITIYFHKNAVPEWLADVMKRTDDDDYAEIITRCYPVLDCVFADGLIFKVRSDREGLQDELMLTMVLREGDVVIPEEVEDMTVTAIDGNAFYHRQGIEKVVLPDTIDYIPDYAFAHCSVTEINIPKNVHAIPSYLFSGCTELKKVKFHEGIMVAAQDAFYEVPIELPESIEAVTVYNHISDTYAVSTMKDGDWRCIAAHVNGGFECRITEYIGKDSSITVPDTLNGAKVVECSAVFGSNTESITFPASIKKVNVDLSGNENIKKIVFESGDVQFSGSFDGSSVEEAVIPASAAETDRLFSDCKQLKSVTLTGTPQKLTIGIEAFRGCNALKNFEFSGETESITIRRSAFSECDSLGSFNIPDKCRSISIGSNAFESSGILSLDADSRWDIGSYSFMNCKNLASLTLNGAKTGFNTFQGCTGIKSAEVLGNTVLGYGTFRYCTALENIDLDDTVRSDHPFINCPGLYSINSVKACSDGEFAPEIRELVYRHFLGADDVGFMNDYVSYKVNEAVKEIITPDMTDIEKVKAVHDWVCRNTEYDHVSTRDKGNHTDASVFLTDKTVCDGYARACNLLYHAAGIESCYVYSTNHAWNIVKLGGHYFHADSTWDDGDVISREWFLRTDKELKAAGGDHAAWSMDSPSSLHSFQPETMPECECPMGDANGDGAVNTADMVTLSRYLMGAGKLSEDDRFLPDLNYDGSVDTFDLVALREKIVNL